MSKEQFKIFAKNHPELINHVQSNSMTWQQFYEMYDIYGEAPEAWDKYITKETSTTKTKSAGNKTSFSDITNIFKKVDTNNIQKHIGTAQKAIGLFQEFGTKNASAASLLTKSAKPTAARPLNRFFED